MPKRSAKGSRVAPPPAAVPASPIPDEEMADDSPARLPSSFKLVSELLALADHDFPAETIDEDIRTFSTYADLSDWKGIHLCYISLASLSRRASTYDNWPMRFRVAEYLVSCFNGLKEDLREYVCACVEAQATETPHTIKPELVDTVTMFVIIAQRLTVQLQLYVSKTIATAQQSKGRGKAKVLDDDIMNWKSIQRLRMIHCLIELLDFKVDTVNGLKKKAIRYVFAPETIETDFYLRFMETVSGLLEDPENTARASQPWIATYFRIWKCLVTDYNFSSNIANSLFTNTMELNYLENANNFPFIEPLVYIMKEEANNPEGQNATLALRALLVRIIRRAIALYDGERSTRVPPKAYALIITSLAVNVHDIMLQELFTVFRLLNNPNYNVRMAALQALCDMFQSPWLSAERCNEFTTRKEKRYSIFKKLVAHTNDEGTHVRAKAVALLRNLVENRQIPEEYQSSGFVTVVGSRLIDKSVQVRKAAMQFMTVFLDNNTYGHDFNRDAHLRSLDEKTRELKSKEGPSSRIIKEVTDFFRKIKFDFKTSAKAELTRLFSENQQIDEHLSLSTLFNNLKTPQARASYTDIARFYASRHDFPYPLSVREPLDNNGLELVDEAVEHVVREAESDYLVFRTKQAFDDDDQMMNMEQDERDRQQGIMQLRAQIQQLIDKMSIEMEISKCVPLALRCVLMGETAEIKEGIKFLTSCKMFGISGADEAIRSMCTLVWRPSSDIIDELIEAAENMFLSNYEGNDRAERTKSTVDNLMAAMTGATESDRSSVEEVIYLLASPEIERKTEDKPNKTPRKRKVIEPTVITRLWSIAMDATAGDIERKTVALRVLFPISRTENGIPEARSRIRSLQKKLVEEPVLAVEALRIISILGTPTKQETEPEAYSRPIFKIHHEDSLFKSIEQLLFHEVFKVDTDPNRDWFNIIRLSIASILNISMDVNIVIPRMVAQFLYRVGKISEFYIYWSKKAENAKSAKDKDIASRRRDYWALTECRVLEKFMAFSGELANQLHAFIQVTIPRLHTRYVTKIVEAEKNDSTIREEPARCLTDLEKSIAQRKTIFAVPEDVTPEHASNDLHHLVSVMCDKRLFVPNKLLGRLFPVVVYCMRTTTMPARVKEAAFIAFGKFMPLSSEISSFAAPSFFTTMVRSDPALLRCNLVAACCDFAFAQPTLFELYAPSLFRMAQDKSPLVRESTILVLSNLMSNDMIQIRGVLSEPARCISDSARAVREAAQSFFRELNARSETIVQLLPEFVYRLASSDERLSLKSYKAVFEFLIVLIKDKNKTSTDNMIDRICLKFSNIDMNDTEAPKYLLLALSRFGQNDGGLQKLQDNWRHWSRFLCHPEVAIEYRNTIEHMRNTSKNEEFKKQCNELIANIDKIQEEGLRKEDIAAAPATTKKGRGRKPAAARNSSPGPSNRTPKRKRRPAVREESEEEESEEEPEEEPEEEEVEDADEEEEGSD